MAPEGHTAEETGDVPSNPSQPSQEDLERQDFDVIANFFASGGGDDEDDERVWEQLEKHVRVPHRTLNFSPQQLRHSNHVGLPVHGLSIMQPTRSKCMPVSRN